MLAPYVVRITTRLPDNFIGARAAQSSASKQWNRWNGWNHWNRD